MLFHNRHVKAAMGSVIANGGVQLNRAQSLEGMFQSSQLYIWGLSANDLSRKVKVGVSGCIGNQFCGRQFLILSVLLLLSFKRYHHNGSFCPLNVSPPIIQIMNRTFCKSGDQTEGFLVSKVICLWYGGGGEEKSRQSGGSYCTF